MPAIAHPSRHPVARGDIPLTVAAARPAIRPSRYSKWRAAVLIGVHGLIAIHLVHWRLAGTTLSPVEPAEAMEFSKTGVVNAGVVFFSLAILSTLVLGRFFCGWGCHLIALQDLCRWLLGKIGIRPRPFRSRLLAWAPLFAFFYMFILPLLDPAREDAGGAGGAEQLRLTTEAFWATFPGWIIGGVTFLVCGFLIVYFLGSKGFCTYGCPYGGIFYLVDRAAVGRIRVTDACEGCGHCTAVCSSNVRVHQEVRDFGMVVDPGCMKCMDCVSVCPHGALYFGFGRPAALSRKRTPPSGPAKRPAPSCPWTHVVVYTACLFAVTWVLFGNFYDVVPPWAWAGAAVLMGYLTARGRGECSWPQELLLTGVFLLSLATFRGLYGIPFLMSLGLSAIVAFVALRSWELLATANVRLQNFSLKRGGRWTPAGAVYVCGVAAFALFWLHSGAVRIAGHFAQRIYEDSGTFVTTFDAALRSGDRLSADQRAEIRRGLAWAGWLDRWGLIHEVGNDMRLAWFHLLLGHEDDAEKRLRRAAETGGPNGSLRRDLAALLAARGRTDEALAELRRAVDADPDDAQSYVAAAGMLTALGRFDEAARVYDEALAALGTLADGRDAASEARPYGRGSARGDPHLLPLSLGGRGEEEALPDGRGSAQGHSRRLKPAAQAVIHHNYAILEAVRGDMEAAVGHFRQALALNPESHRSRHLLGEGLCALGRFDEGINELKLAAAALPDDLDVRRTLIEALAAAGRIAEAKAELATILKIAPLDAALHEWAASICEEWGDPDRTDQLRQAAQRLRGFRASSATDP